MQLLDSIVDGALIMPSQKDAEAFVFAVVKYMRTGEEPKNLKGGALSSWVMCFPALENSRARSLAGSKPSGTGKRRKNQTDDQTPNQNGNQNKNQTDDQTANQNAIKRANEQDSSSSSYSSSSSSVEGSGEEGFTRPSLDEVKTYFAANCLRGDPELFWATYEAKGWVDGSGMPILNWRAQALRWSRRQVGMDAEKPPGGEPVWKPTKSVPTDDEIERMRAEVARLEGEL